MLFYQEKVFALLNKVVSYKALHQMRPKASNTTTFTQLIKFVYSLHFDHNFAISSLRNVCHTKGNTSGVAQLHERVEPSNDVR
jgi:hypothetical protein